ncbi:hypothetical protein NL676_020685 [Syzygium grande]|nr:hypothetical protein NL676_020685 [Syzygium grande]
MTNQIVCQAPEEPQMVELDVGWKEEIEATLARIENSDFEANELDEVDGIVDSETESEVEAPPKLVLRRSTWLRKSPKRYTLFASNENCALSIIDDDLSTVKEAKSAEDTK